MTGANGFIGTELVRTLNSNLNNVVEINRINKSGLFRNLNLSGKQDVKKIADKIREFDPDVIFHLASNTSIKASWENPFEFIRDNILLSENLLEAIELSGIEPLLILLSSSAVYDDSNLEIPETFRLAPSSPYAISKLSSETIALRYPNTMVIRPFFTIGANRRGDIIDEWLSGINTIRASGKPGTLNVGDLTLLRDYLDVEVSAKLLVEIAMKGSAGEIYNLCSGVGTTMQNVCNALIKATGSGKLVAVQSEIESKSISKHKVIGDKSKLAKLGIKPYFDLNKTINKILSDRKN